MGLWTITGGTRLYGTVGAQGSRNSTLALLAGCLAVGGITVLERVPRVKDVELMLEILRRLGCRIKREGDRVTVDSRAAAVEMLPIELMEQLWSSLLLCSAMLGRFGEAKVPIPSAYVSEEAPMELHLTALQSMGADVRFEESEILCSACGLQGGEVTLPYPAVGATINVMLAACGAEDETVLCGCAKAPEIVELAAYLSSAGVSVTGAGTDVMRIRRRKCVGNTYHRMQADPLTSSVLLCAVGACGGKLILQEVISSHLQPTLDVLGEMGCNIKIRESEVILQSDGSLWAPNATIVTGAYPSIPTELLQPMLSACLKADGVTVIKDGSLGRELRKAKLLRRFGSDIWQNEEGTAVVTGVRALHGANVCVRDLWSGAAVLLAALQAEGESCIVDNGCISRGFAYLDATLRQLGAQLEFTE